MGWRAIDLRCLEIVFRDRSEARGVDNQAEPGPQPHGSENEPEERRFAVDEPALVEVRDTDRSEERGYHPRPFFEQEAQHHPSDDHGRDHAEENRRFHDRGAFHVAEDQGEPEPEEQGDRQVDRDPERVVDERSERRRPREAGGVNRRRVRDHALVVSESRCSLRSHEAQINGLENRVYDEENHEDKGRGKEDHTCGGLPCAGSDASPTLVPSAPTEEGGKA